jgi:hypothetical protein
VVTTTQEARMSFMDAVMLIVFGTLAVVALAAIAEGKRHRGRPYASFEAARY